MLKDPNSILDDLVGFHIPRCLDLKVESCWDCVIVKGFALLWGVLPFSMFALGPILGLDK